MRDGLAERPFNIVQQPVHASGHLIDVVHRLDKEFHAGDQGIDRTPSLVDSLGTGRQRVVETETPDEVVDAVQGRTRTLGCGGLFIRRGHGARVVRLRRGSYGLFLGLAELYITIIIGTNQRTGGVQDPAQRRFEVPRRRVSLRVEITFNVVDRAFQDKDLVSEAVEFSTLNDELIFTQFQFFGSLSGNPVPLPAGLATELPGATTRGTRRHGLSAPHALSRRGVVVLFRHDEKVGHLRVVVVD